MGLHVNEIYLHTVVLLVTVDLTSVRLSRPIHSRAPVLERAADEFCLVSI
jgi:hypothetical protein